MGWAVWSSSALIALACETSPTQTGSVPARLLKLAPQGEAEAPSGAGGAERAEPDTTTRPVPRAPAPPSREVAPEPSNLAPPDAGAGVDDGSTAPQWATAADLTVKRGVVTHRVVDREPAPVSTLRLTQREEPFVAFFELANGSSRPARLVVTFIHESGAEVGFIELQVPERRERWRTWAETRRVRLPGQWRAVIRTVAGEQVGQIDFVVAPRLEGGASPTGSGEQ